MSDQKLDPVWCEVNCASCGLGVRIEVQGWLTEHRTEKGMWVTREFESEESEECVCGAVPDVPSEKDLAALYDHYTHAEEPPRHGWLTYDSRPRRLP